MQSVRIYRQSKSQMQAGRAVEGCWIIEAELPSPRKPEPLMGWIAAGDTLSQMKIEFPTREAAEQFAKSNGWRYTLIVPHGRKAKPRNYGQNFVYHAEDEA